MRARASFVYSNAVGFWFHAGSLSRDRLPNKALARHRSPGADPCGLLSPSFKSDGCMDVSFIDSDLNSSKMRLALKHCVITQ
jgi:hypothetical protein